ncbi:acetyl-CoA carboxylase biotin carboxyl carrier protein [Corynebacterium lehmanniae]|uniref:acetyl-CoA carboxylase biotin carboxyl carrier protein n=1 Tax=Corynebacterium haemomassiliense TaxID=2754726 RepID=UPI00370DAC7E
MSDNTNFNELKSLLEWVNQSGDIEELSIKYGDIELALSKTPGGLSHLKAAPAAAPAPAPAAPEAPKAEAPAPEPAPAPAAAPAPAEAPKEDAPKPEAAAPASSGTGIEVKSPMVGTFYAAPKPGADPFVKVGDTVEVGQVLCIVEVMKLMNNIEAKTAGTVTEILVDNEDAVEHGQPLMVIEPK